MGFLGLLLHFFKRWEWREYSACSVCYATAPFAPCPLFVSTNMGSKRWKDSKMAKKCDMNVWVGRFKRFCEVREDHKTWWETFFLLHNQSYAPKFSEWIVCHILLIFCVQQYMRSPVCNRGCTGSCFSEANDYHVSLGFTNASRLAWEILPAALILQRYSLQPLAGGSDLP